MRHRRTSALAFSETFLDFQNLGALKRANLGGKFFQRCRENRERAQVLGVAVALQNLRGSSRGLEAQTFANQILDLRVDVGIRADGARNLSITDSLARREYSRLAAAQLLDPHAEFGGE